MRRAVNRSSKRFLIIVRDNREMMADGADGARFVLNDETRHAVFDQFRDRSRD